MDEAVKKRLQGFLEMGGFDKALPGLTLIDAAAGKATLKLVVSKEVQNLGGNLHGGAVATIVDDAGTIAIMTADQDSRPGVTTDINVSYFSAGRAGDTVIIEATTLKAGKHMAYVSVDLRRESDGKLIAQGRMSKFMT